MIAFGETSAKIVRHYVGANDNGTPFVGMVFLPRGEEETITAKIYVTPKSLRFAAKQLAACGFDIVTGIIEDLEANQELLAGREAKIDITEQEFNGRKFTKAEIVVPLPTVDKVKLSSLSEAMRKAVKDDGAPKAPAGPKATAAPKPPPAKLSRPAVDDIPPSKQADLDAQAAGEDIPF